MEQSLEQRIRERAYEIWDATGREDGRADEHWLSAERELLAKGQPAAAKSRLAHTWRLNHDQAQLRAGATQDEIRRDPTAWLGM